MLAVHFGISSVQSCLTNTHMYSVSEWHAMTNLGMQRGSVSPLSKATTIWLMSTQHNAAADHVYRASKYSLNS